MSEGAYRVGKLILLAVFVLGLLCLGWRATNTYQEASQASTANARRAAENGRFQPYAVDSIGGYHRGPYAMDTRDGGVVESSVVHGNR